MEDRYLLLTCYGRLYEYDSYNYKTHAYDNIYRVSRWERIKIALIILFKP